MRAENIGADGPRPVRTQSFLCVRPTPLLSFHDCSRESGGAGRGRARASGRELTLGEWKGVWELHEVAAVRAPNGGDRRKHRGGPGAQDGEWISIANGLGMANGSGWRMDLSTLPPPHRQADWPLRPEHLSLGKKVCSLLNTWGLSFLAPSRHLGRTLLVRGHHVPLSRAEERP